MDPDIKFVLLDLASSSLILVFAIAAFFVKASFRCFLLPACVVFVLSVAASLLRVSFVNLRIDALAIYLILLLSAANNTISMLSFSFYVLAFRRRVRVEGARRGFILEQKVDAQSANG